MKALLALIAVVVVGVGIYFLIARTSPPTDTTSLPIASSTTMKLTSPAFEANGLIPAKYTCDADKAVSPPLAISGVPGGAKSLALIMDDPDVPKQLKPDGVFDHWVVYSIAPTTSEISEGSVPGAMGLNGAGQAAYTGPCPPPQYEPKEHRYFFRVYALDTELNFVKAPTKAEVLTAIEGHIIDQSELIGRYARK